MEILVDRKWSKPNYCIGRLYINGKFICNTLEDTVRDLNKNGKFDNGEFKIYGKTAIPYGTYEVTLDVVSPKFSKYPFYMTVCQGKLPRLLNVPSFEGILIHCADGPKGADLLSGCIGVGDNTSKGCLSNGKARFKQIYTELKKARLRNEKITIKIV